MGTEAETVEHLQKLRTIHDRPPASDNAGIGQRGPGPWSRPIRAENRWPAAASPRSRPVSTAARRRPLALCSWVLAWLEQVQVDFEALSDAPFPIVSGSDFLRTTCYCPRREHGNRRETTTASPDSGPYRRHAARRQRHPGGDSQRLHDCEPRDRGNRPRGRLPSRRCDGSRPVPLVLGRRARRRLLAARRDAGVTVTPDQSGRVVPEHRTHVTSDQFKAGLVEVRDETGWSRHAALDGDRRRANRDASGPAPVKIPAARGVLVGSRHTGRGSGRRASLSFASMSSAGPAPLTPTYTWSQSCGLRYAL